MKKDVRRGFMKTEKNQTWVYNQDIDLEVCGEGIILDIFTPMRVDFVG